MSSDIQFSVYLNNNVRELSDHTGGDAALTAVTVYLLFFNEEFKCIIILMSLDEPSLEDQSVLSMDT